MIIFSDIDFWKAFKHSLILYSSRWNLSFDQEEQFLEVIFKHSFPQCKSISV